jgi:chromatin segregation and condensation protein Rec8/ScpA/Scc1 (kleisin family)
MMADERSTHLTISLPRFDGPFDLLLALIRRNEWSIDDLPVVAITGQFLAYIQQAQELDAELAGEFVETASWLVLLKSRSLLPRADDKASTPREELRRAVLDHATLAATTEFLRERYAGHPHPAGPGAARGRQSQVLPPSVEDDPTVQDVLEAALRALETARAAASFRSSDAEGVTVAEQMHWLAQKLGPIPFQTAISTAEWFTRQPDHGSQAALLLALLELARLGVIILHQPKHLASICLKPLRAVPEDVDVKVFAYDAEPKL